MKKFLLGISLLTLAACTSNKKETMTTDNDISLLVGTYTTERSHGIYSLRFDQTTGEAVLVDSASAANPSFVTTDADGQRVYAVSEMPDSTAALLAYTFDKETGKFTFINRQLTHGADPCYVATRGKRLFTANYSGGTMTAFSLTDEGALLPADSLYQGTATGPDSVRQCAPHIHCTDFTPDGKQLLATDFSADRLLVFNLPDNSAPTLASIVPLKADNGPRHFTFSPDGKQLYIIGELSGAVTACHYHAGRIEAFQTIQADTLQARGSADIHTSPDGRFLYVSNRLKGDGLAIFRIETDGRLASVGYQPTGVHPRNFGITPNGKYLLVACRDSNVIQVFERDSRTGLLKDTGKNISLSQPVCVRFVP